jgi:hypothetical protein
MYCSLVDAILISGNKDGYPWCWLDQGLFDLLQSAAIASVKLTPSLTTQNISGTTSPKCKGTKRYLSSVSTPQRMDVPALHSIQHLKIPPAHRMHLHGRVSSCGHSCSILDSLIVLNGIEGWIYHWCQLKLKIAEMLASLPAWNWSSSLIAQVYWSRVCRINEKPR